MYYILSIKIHFQFIFTQILAHELGHNFGMMHDFDDSLGGKGNPCNGDGLMSYGSFDQPLRWSSCSRASFEHHYFGLDWGCNCLLDISGKYFIKFLNLEIEPNTFIEVVAIIIIHT